MPQIKRKLTAQEAFPTWTPKELMDRIAVEAATNTDFWREHFLDEVTSYRTSIAGAAPAKRARLTPNEQSQQQGFQPGRASWPGGPSGGPYSTPNKPGTKRQICRAH